MYLWVLASFAFIFLGGCSASETMITDTGTDLVVEVEQEAYLDLSLLEKTEEVSDGGEWNGYDVYTLEYGTFSTSIIEKSASLRMLETNRVKAEYSFGNMILTELLVSRYSYVEEGDVLAKVMVEASETDLEEKELKLKRLEEEYAKVLSDYNERHEEAVANISVYNHPGKIDRLEIAQMERDFEQTVANYEQRIEAYKDEIESLKESMNMKEIVAPQSGFVLYVERLQVGEGIKNGTVICSMAPADKIVLEFEDETMHYGYGMDLTLRARDRQKFETGNYEASVLSSSGKALKEDWGQTTAIIGGDYKLEDIIGKGTFMVGGETNVMKNVLLIPKEAVTEEKGKCYVTVINEDETLEKRQFLPGGNNTKYYWVFSGLEQGTKIIVKN